MTVKLDFSTYDRTSILKACASALRKAGVVLAVKDYAKLSTMLKAGTTPIDACKYFYNLAKKAA